MTKNIRVTLNLDGTELSAFSSISLNQEFNAHHTFEVLVNHDVLEQFGSSTLDVSKKYIGKFISISFGEKDTSEHTFKGIVTEISMVQSHGAWANIALKGYSPTYLLEGDSHYSSYYNKTLKNIVDDSLTHMPSNAMPYTVKPKFSKTIPYMCQYKESHFQFINRLAAEYGEWFYYNGEKLFFGKPDDQPKVNLNYGEDLEEMSLSVRIVPANITHYSYNSGEDKVLTSPSPGSAQGANSYAKHALNVADSLYTKPVKQAPSIRTAEKDDLNEYAKQQKERQASSTVLLRAKGSNPKVKLGSKIKVAVIKKEGSKESTIEQGEYLVTGINHHITGTFKYTHTLEALPAVIEVLPIQLSKPMAETQMAIVKDNNDPQKTGRIRVQMLWQQEKGEMTDWIRVLTPDAGSSDKVSKNRGFVFIPEVGDQVFVGFRYNDPNRPFVLGSMFHGKIAEGGGASNKTKSLATRSGNKLELNDEHGSVYLTDKGGANTMMDGAGNITTNAGAMSLINVGAKKNTPPQSILKMDSGGIITLDGKTNIKLKVGDDSYIEITKDTITIKSTNLILEGTKSKITSKADTLIDGGTTTISPSGITKITGSEVQINRG